jgi:choline-sulfatase
MIETMDAQVGTIRAAFKEYTAKSLRPSVMVYLSDHGDQRAVLSELIDSKGGGMTCARMVRKGKYKLISYQGYEDQDLLFDLEADPWETKNRAQEEQLVLDSLRALIKRGWKPDAVLKNHRDYLAQIELVKAWEQEVGPDDSERWKATPPEARVVPPMR